MLYYQTEVDPVSISPVNIQSLLARKGEIYIIGLIIIIPVFIKTHIMTPGKYR